MCKIVPIFGLFLALQVASAATPSTQSSHQNELKAGQRVHSKDFGSGTIYEFKENLARVKFDHQPYSFPVVDVESLSPSVIEMDGFHQGDGFIDGNRETGKIKELFSDGYLNVHYEKWNSDYQKDKLFLGWISKQVTCYQNTKYCTDVKFQDPSFGKAKILKVFENGLALVKLRGSWPLLESSEVVMNISDIMLPGRNL